MRPGLGALLVVLFAGQTLAAQAPRLVSTIELPGVQGRIDHMDLDEAGQRLFVAALENNSVEVVDLAAGRVSRSLPNLGAPQGVVYVPETRELWVASRDTGDLVILDGSTFQVKSRLAFGDEADNLHAVPGRPLVLLGYGDGGVAYLDSRTDRLLGTVALGGHPEGFQAQRSTGRIFVNVPTAGALFVLDLETPRVVQKWTPGGLLSNFPLAVQESRRRGAYFSHVPGRITLFDTMTGRTIAQRDAPWDVDDLFFDDRDDSLYLVSGAGRLERWAVGADDTLRVLGSVATGAGARTGLLAAGMGRCFVAVPRRGSQAARLLVFALQP